MRYFRYPERILLAACLMLLLLAAPRAARAGSEGWPRHIAAEGGTLIVYEPEYDSFSETELTGRAALAWDAGGEAGRVFGALWFSATTRTDREARRVQVQSAPVTDVRFPGDTAAGAPPVERIMEDEISRWNLPLDDLTRKLAMREKERQSAESLSSLPPKILFADAPATLIIFDGEPEWRPVEGTGFLRAVNTPALIVLDPATGRHYLSSGEDWMTAARLDGPWEAEPSPPAQLAELSRRADAEEEDLPPQDPRLPRVIIANEPTELIVTDGEPRYKLFPGNDLLYISNTENDVLLDVASQRHFLLLSGRWFSSWSLDGPWTFVPADSLPASFGKIPADSPKAHLLNHVAGTPEAARAVRDAQVPRITAVNRHEASLEVTYDGPPRFEPIEGTAMRYAINTRIPVIEIRGRYYAVDDGVWFTAESAYGPWVVADSVPDEILTLPPESPVYHTKFVRVYDSTPDVVYVGYTPGYFGGYVYHGTVVYGTGYHYRPWIGAYYYPWPYTWGLGAYYDPWYGWGFWWGFLFWYGWGHHHHYDHHHHIYIPPHHRHPDRRHKSIFHRSPGWWGPGGYRTFERDRDGFDRRRETRRDGERSFDRKRPLPGREFPSPEKRRFVVPKPGKKDFRDGMNRRDRIGPGETRPPEKPRGFKDEAGQPRKNYFTDRFNKKDRIKPEPEREFPRDYKSRGEGDSRQKGGDFIQPGKRMPDAGGGKFDSPKRAPSPPGAYRHTPRYSPPGAGGGARPAPAPRATKPFKSPSPGGRKYDSPGRAPSPPGVYRHAPRYSPPNAGGGARPALAPRATKPFKAPSMGGGKPSSPGPSFKGGDFGGGRSSGGGFKAFRGGERRN